MKKFFAAALMAVTAMALSAGMAIAAISVESAKSQGLVGERYDGMLGVVSAATPDVSALVATTNAERLAKYQSIAARNGTGVEQVKTLAGKKLIGSAKPGEYVMPGNGGWQKK
jgi:uncharacterized protein YdbL (DUF1318 family)